MFRNPFSFKCFLVTVVLGLAAIGNPSVAAIITFEAATTVAQDSDVSTSRTLLNAYNLGSASPAVVNGIIFSGTGTGAPAFNGPTFGSSGGDGYPNSGYTSRHVFSRQPAAQPSKRHDARLVRGLQFERSTP